MDLNLTVLCGSLAATPTEQRFSSGERMVRLLVTTRVTSPARRVDVVPVTFWQRDMADERFDVIVNLERGTRVWVAGAVQRRFYDVGNDESRSKIEVMAFDVQTRADDNAKEEVNAKA